MPSGTDVQRLVLQVDASVELAKRSLKDLANAVDRDAADIDKALQRTSNSHQRMVTQLGKSGQARAGMQQLSYQLGDISSQMAVGTKASVIFAQQAGQTIQAIQLMSSNTSGFLRILAGPWGVALTSAIVVLSSFAGKLFENKDEVGKLVEKMREHARQADLNRQADEAWKQTVEGLTEAIRKRREEQEKAIQSDALAEQQSLNSARAELASQRENLNSARGKLSDAQRVVADLKANRDRLSAAPGREGSDTIALANRQIAAAEARVKAIQGQVVSLQLSIFQAEQSVRGAEAAISTRSVQNKLDPVKKATDDYATAVANLNRERQAGNISGKEFEDRLEAEERKLEKAKKAAQGASKAVGEFGREVSAAEAASIARAGGLQVNSANRPTWIKDEMPGGGSSQERLYNDWVAKGRPADNPVAKPGTSAHEGANGKWALDIQITADVTPDKIKKVFASQGVRLTKVFKEKGHYHVEGSRGAAAREENAAAREAEQQLARDNAFAESKDRLNQELLAAQLELVTGIEAQAEAAKDQVLAEQKRRDNAVANDVAEGKLGALQGEELKLINERIAKQRIANIEIDRQIRTLQEQDRAESEAAERKIEGLRFEDEMARTQSARRAVQMQILDLVYEEKERHLQTLKAQAELAGNIEEAARIQAEINELPIQRARDEERTRRGTMGPLEAYRDRYADIGDQNEQAVVNFLEAEADALSRVTDGWKAMKEAALDAVKSLLQTLLRNQLNQLISGLLPSGGFNLGSIFGGGVSGGASGLGSSALDFVTPGMGSLAGGGDLALPALASGGWRPIGGRGGVDQNVLAINGVPQARVSANENIAILPPAPPRAMLPSQAGSAATGGVAAGGGAGGRPNVSMTVYANNADSFRRSERQITRQLQRRMDRR